MDDFEVQDRIVRVRCGCGSELELENSPLPWTEMMADGFYKEHRGHEEVVHIHPSGDYVREIVIPTVADPTFPGVGPDDG